jgi:hypothetical protein
MSDADDLSFVVRLLESAGLHLERIPTAHTRRCDLRASDTHERYLIEVKGFHDDEAINRNLRAGEVYERSRSFDVSSTVDSAIRDAVEQLRKTLDQRKPELRLICLLSRNRIDAEVVRQQIVGVLYGKRSLVPSTIDSREHHECLYFAESAFYRHRKCFDVAVIIFSDDSFIFCVNDHSSNRERVQKSMLGRYFTEAFYDQYRWEREGFFIADCPFDRGDEQEVRLYVEQKYGLGPTTLMRFNRHSAMFSVTDPR